MNWKSYRLFSLLAVMTLAVQVHTTRANDFPSRQVQVVVPFTPGATVDIAARIFATKLASYWGQPVIVDNRPGASTTLAARFVSQATADGYTLLFSLNETFTVVPHMAQHRSFQPMADLAPIHLLATLMN